MKAGVDVFGRRSRRESLCIRVSHQVPFAEAFISQNELLICF